jgi:hypothetical protein
MEANHFSNINGHRNFEARVHKEKVPPCVVVELGSFVANRISNTCFDPNNRFKSLLIASRGTRSG